MRSLFLSLLVVTGGMLWGQQYPDTTFTPFIEQAAYLPGTGPTVFFDAGHDNFGAERRGYAALHKLLVRDGYQVRVTTHDFTKKDGFRIEGREAIDKYWFSFQGLTEKWTLTSDRIYGNGDLAIQLGTSEISYRSPGSEEVRKDVTRFTLGWRKNSAGNWKIISDQYSGK